MHQIYSQIVQIIWPISPIEAIFTVFALFAWSRAFLRFRAKVMNQKEIIFWTLLWFSIIVIVFIPGKTTTLAQLLGMGRGFDALTFIAIIALFYAVYRLYAKSNENEQIITELVRQIALRNGTTKKNRSKLGSKKWVGKRIVSRKPAH